MTYCKKIHRAAVSRFNNKPIKRAYSTRLKWVFSPNPNYIGAFTKSEMQLAIHAKFVVSAADARNLHRRSRKWSRLSILNFWNRQSLIASMQRELGYNLSRWPAGEYMIHVGDSKLLTCMLYVFDSLYQVAGIRSFLSKNGIYPSAAMIFLGSLSPRLREISTTKVEPGDIFASRFHTGFVNRTLVPPDTKETPLGLRAWFEARDSNNPMRITTLARRRYKFFRVFC